jgi:hypothetical protein
VTLRGATVWRAAEPLFSVATVKGHSAVLPRTNVQDSPDAMFP